ncbi:MAG: hypothetical protein E7590_08485 [Ruminococcaceae bacterium]|nr:hypothetical protein [Oscillospiraceae bacterium]
MKFIVGYPIRENRAFLEDVIRAREQIAEVYFSWGDTPNGRSALTADTGETAFETQQRQARDLKLLSDAGLRFNLLFNANCYGRDAQSRAFFSRLGDLVDYVQHSFGLASVTTASPLIAKFVKENFPGIDTRASVNMEIGTVEGISYVADYFDSFYVKREYNRDRAALQRLRDWCDQNGKQMYLLANSGCLNYCSAHNFHDNLVAHEAEIAAMDNGYRFGGVCWDHLKDPANAERWLQRTNFIRPEDISLYEAFTPAMKLATRVNAVPVRVLNAYLDGRYRGSAMELLEPNHSGIFYPHYVENSLLGSDFAERVMSCDKRCEQCGYCAEVMRRATVTLESDPSMKL